MNERFRELYHKSFVVDDRCGYVNLGPNGPSLNVAFDPDKFAELIIKECIAWVEDNNGHDGPSISEMREHFGVEE